MLTQQIKSTILPQPKLSELYSEIELSEEERNDAIEKALFEARYTKAAAINSREYLAKLCAPVEKVRYTAEQLYKYLEETKDFVIDDDNREIVILLCQYFSEDPEFEKDGRKLSKGILLFGGLGVGKTHLLTLFRNNQKQSYQVVTCQDVESVYAKNGPDADPKTGTPGLRKFFGMVPLNGTNIYGQEGLGYLFDDLGQEITNTKYYGTERNVMLEVLSQRYKNNLHTATHLTTNLSGEQIKELYGARVADRMREMFNIIQFNSKAPSRRK